jgi:glycosyltransferase involved in cell wall biosynthesis
MVGPSVSIVIPCHNYGRFLGEAIESALAQTYAPVEVVVVDDGSTDDTPDVANAYPVRIIRQTQQGVSGAITRGIRESSGALVMRLDADDILEPTYVAETVAALERDARAHFAYTEVAYFGATTGTYPIQEFDVETLAERNYIHGSALMRRSSFDQVGGYDPRLSDARCEDWDLWLAFADHHFRGVLVPKPLLRYRQHPRAATSRNTLRWSSVSLWRRNIALASRLQDNHPLLFSAAALRRRLARLPSRLARHEVTARFAGLLVCLYGVMLIRSLWRTSVTRLVVDP